MIELRVLGHRARVVGDMLIVEPRRPLTRGEADHIKAFLLRYQMAAHTRIVVIEQDQAEATPIYDRLLSERR